MPLPESMLTYHQMIFCGIHTRAISRVLVYLTCNISSEITVLTHWGRLTHMCVSKLTIIGSDNGLSPGRRQAIIWTNAGILLIKPLETNFSELLIKIHTFTLKKIHFKMSSGKWRLFCLDLNVLNVLPHLPGTNELIFWRRAPKQTLGLSLLQYGRAALYS